MTAHGSALQRVTKSTAMLLFGNLLRMLFIMAFVVYAARFLGVEGYGRFALTQNLVELSLSLAATGLGILVTRETAKHPQWLSCNLAPAIVLVLALSVAAGALLVLFAQVANYALATRLAIFVAALALLPGGLVVLSEAVLVATDKSQHVGIGMAAESLARVALGFAVLFLGYGLLSLFAVLILTRWAQLLLYVLLLRGRLRTVEWVVTSGALKLLIRAWRVFAFENWLSTLYLSLDVVFLSLFHGEAAVGIYEAGQKLIRLGSVAARCFTTAVFPIIARLYVEAENKFHRVNLQSTKYILAAILPVVIGISLGAPQIVIVVYGREYSDSIPVLQILAWILIPQFLNPFLSHVLFARGEQRRSLVVAAIALASFLVAALLFIPQWAVVGTACAALVAAMTALACYLAFIAAGTSGRAIVAMLLRQTVAAGVLFAFCTVVKGTSALWLLAGATLYVVLLIGLRIIRASDLRLLQELH